MPVYLRVGDLEPEQAIPFRTILAAARTYRRAALTFPGGNVSDAALHLPRAGCELSAIPDYVMSLTPRGSVRIHRTH